MSIKSHLMEEMKNAMRAQEKARLSIIRLMLSAIKQKEIDERIEITDSQAVTLFEKMIKQRRESIGYFEQAGREDQANQEKYEISFIETYLPELLSPREIDKFITEAIAQTGAVKPQDLGKVMAALKPQLSGRADMSLVGQKIRQHLIE